MEERKKFLEQWDHFLTKINWKDSYLDADAIKFMNEFKVNFENIIELTKKKEYSSSYVQGYADGHAIGYEDGHEKGRNEGYNEGFEEGHIQGFNGGSDLY